MQSYAKGVQRVVFTAAQAAKAVGKSTSTITRAIDNGKLSANKADDGSWRIDAAELYRAFAPAKLETHSIESDATPSAKHPLQAELDLTLEKLRSSEALSARLADEVSDLRADRDAWRQQAERKPLLLQDHRNIEVGLKRTGWLDRFFRIKNN